LTTRANSAASELERRIVMGEYPVGSQLPPEAELAASLGVSRTTLRDAVGRLEAQGLLVRQQGRGTYVRHRSGVRISMLLEANLSVSDMIRDVGLTPATREVTAAIESPPEEVRIAVRRPQLTHVIAVRRLRTAGGVPAVYSDDYLVPAPDLPTAADGYHGSLYELLNAVYGRPVTSGHARLSAGEVRGPLAERLGVPDGSLTVDLRQVHELEDGTPVMYSHVRLRNDIFAIYVRRGLPVATPVQEVAQTELPRSGSAGEEVLTPKS
jgi:GntR family transcriptional regulator